MSRSTHTHTRTEWLKNDRWLPAGRWRGEGEGYLPVIRAHFAPQPLRRWAKKERTRVAIRDCKIRRGRNTSLSKQKISVFPSLECHVSDFYAALIPSLFGDGKLVQIGISKKKKRDSDEVRNIIVELEGSKHFSISKEIVDSK